MMIQRYLDIFHLVASANRHHIHLFADRKENSDVRKEISRWSGEISDVMKALHKLEDNAKQVT